MPSTPGPRRVTTPVNSQPTLALDSLPRAISTSRVIQADSADLYLSLVRPKRHHSVTLLVLDEVERVQQAWSPQDQFQGYVAVLLTSGTPLALESLARSQAPGDGAAERRRSNQSRDAQPSFVLVEFGIGQSLWRLADPCRNLGDEVLVIMPDPVCSVKTLRASPSTSELSTRDTPSMVWYAGGAPSDSGPSNPS